MKTLLSLVGWCIPFLMCWPLAVLAETLWPIVWLISISLKLFGISIGAVLALIKAILFSPVRMPGYRRCQIQK